MKFANDLRRSAAHPPDGHQPSLPLAARIVAISQAGTEQDPCGVGQGRSRKVERVDRLVTLAPGPWPPSVMTFVSGLQAVQSSLVASDGVAHVWQTRKLGVWSGMVATSLPGYPAWAHDHGGHANLSVKGDARLGKSFTISIDNFLMPGAGLVAVSGSWGVSDTPFGMTLLNLADVILLEPVYNFLGASAYGSIYSRTVQGCP
jgi:hypothetical protein